MSDSYIVPDAIEPFIGYRAWLVREKLLVLYSMGKQELWYPGRAFEAKCGAGRKHDVPDLKCTCGIYAAISWAGLASMPYPRTVHRDKQGREIPVFVGKVALWGDVIEATEGYRAQFAYPLELWLPYTQWKLGKQVAERYNVPVRVMNTKTKPTNEEDW